MVFVESTVTIQRRIVDEINKAKIAGLSDDLTGRKSIKVEVDVGKGIVEVSGKMGTGNIGRGSAMHFRFTQKGSQATAEVSYNVQITKYPGEDSVRKEGLASSSVQVLEAQTIMQAKEIMGKIRPIVDECFFMGYSNSKQ
jgi:hypothetical protein